MAPLLVLIAGHGGADDPSPGALARCEHRMTDSAAPRSARVKLLVTSVMQLSAEYLLGHVHCDNRVAFWVESGGGDVRPVDRSRMPRASLEPVLAKVGLANPPTLRRPPSTVGSQSEADFRLSIHACWADSGSWHGSDRSLLFNETAVAM